MTTQTQNRFHLHYNETDSRMQSRAVAAEAAGADAEQAVRSHFPDVLDVLDGGSTGDTVILLVYRPDDSHEVFCTPLPVYVSEGTSFGEVENSGDEADILRGLRRAGAYDIEVVERPYAEEHGQECVVVAFKFPGTADQLWDELSEKGVC